MTPSDLIAVGALVTALLSLIVAFRGYHVAKRALYISEADHKDKRKEVIGYLINGFKWTAGDVVHASFAVSYTNNASSPNSFKEIVLEIEFYDAEGVFNKAKLSPSVVELPLDLVESREELKAPINLSPKETKSGWLTFQLPKAEGRKFDVDTYRIIATSTADESTLVESYILKSIVKNEK